MSQKRINWRGSKQGRRHEKCAFGAWVGFKKTRSNGFRLVKFVPPTNCGALAAVKELWGCCGSGSFACNV